MAEREITFRLGDSTMHMKAYSDRDWECIRNVVLAAAAGVRAAGGTATATVSEVRKEEL